MSASDSSSPEACTVLYKILTEDEHAALYDSDPEAGTRWSGTSLDLNDGFIHTSTSAQLKLTLGRFFKHVDMVYLLAIPRSASRIEKTLKFDLASTGEKFGHLYEGLDLAAEVASQKAVHRVDGEWQLGHLEF